MGLVQVAICTVPKFVHVATGTSQAVHKYTKSLNKTAFCPALKMAGILFSFAILAGVLSTVQWILSFQKISFS